MIILYLTKDLLLTYREVKVMNIVNFILENWQFFVTGIFVVALIPIGKILYAKRQKSKIDYEENNPCITFYELAFFPYENEIYAGEDVEAISKKIKKPYGNKESKEYILNKECNRAFTKYRIKDKPSPYLFVNLCPKKHANIHNVIFSHDIFNMKLEIKKPDNVSTIRIKDDYARNTTRFIGKKMTFHANFSVVRRNILEIPVTSAYVKAHETFFYVYDMTRMKNKAKNKKIKEIIFFTLDPSKKEKIHVINNYFAPVDSGYLIECKMNNGHTYQYSIHMEQEQGFLEVESSDGNSEFKRNKKNAKKISNI